MVCTACAVALVAGTLTLRPVGDSRTPEDGETVLPGFTFGLTAYAADTGESIAADASGTLTFQSGGAVRWGEGGCYTDFLFQVTGEGAKTVSLTLDRGEFYRWNQQTWDRLGSAAEEAYDPAACYGFWVPGGSDNAQKEGTQAALEASLAALDGARLTVTVSFAGGEVETKRYELHAEQSTLVARPLQSAQPAAVRRGPGPGGPGGPAGDRDIFQRKLGRRRGRRHLCIPGVLRTGGEYRHHQRFLGPRGLLARIRLCCGR